MRARLVALFVGGMVVLALGAQTPKLPDTAAAKQFSLWLTAFNSGQPDSLRAFFQENYPARLAQFDQEAALQRGTGGFDFEKVEESARFRLVSVIKEHNTNIRVRCVVDVEASAPHHMTSLSLRAIPRSRLNAVHLTARVNRARVAPILLLATHRAPVRTRS